MVSIIVPVYNAGDYLSRCVESIIAQTFAEWELILVDDGSTDSSPAICDRFSAADNRIRVIHTSNCGVSAARNEGLSAARGQWISFVDSDDYVAPAYIEDMLDASAGVDIVISGWTEPDGQRAFPQKSLERTDFLELFILKAFINIWGKLIRRDVISGSVVTFDADVKWAEDSMFFIKVLLLSHKVSLVSSCNYSYSHIENSAVARINSYESELSGLNVVNSLMSRLVNVCSYEVIKYFGPYLFILRVFHAITAMNLSRRKSLGLLRSIRFDRAFLYYHPTSFRERIVASLIKNRQWSILLLLYR